MEANAILRELVDTDKPQRVAVEVDKSHRPRGKRSKPPTEKMVFAAPQRLPTGVRRLDDLLDGGLPQGSSTLLYGPPFTGKGVAQELFFLEGLRAGCPSIYLLTDTSASEMSRILTRLDPKMPEYEAKGLAAYVDVYTRLIGERESHPNAHYLEDPRGWETVLHMVEKVESEHPRGKDGPARLVVQSISTLMVEIGPQPTFRFLRQLLGRFGRRGGTALVAAEAGMHEPHHVQTLKHLCSGMISTRDNNEKYYLRVEGLPTAFQPGWVEYSFDPTRFELIGSFASGRIRGGPSNLLTP